LKSPAKAISFFTFYSIRLLERIEIKEQVPEQPALLSRGRDKTHFVVSVDEGPFMFATDHF